MHTLEAARLDLAQLEAIILLNNKIALSDEALATVRASYDFLKAFSQDKLIYGINTGFGPMAQYRINDEDREALQYISSAATPRALAHC